MRRNRRENVDNDEDAEPQRQRRRLAGPAAAVAAASAAGGRITRLRARAAAAAEAPAGPDDGPQPAAAAAAAAQSDDDYEQEDASEEVSSEGEEQEEEEEQGDVPSDDSNERAAKVVRQMGLMPPGAETDDDEEVEAADEEDEYEDETEDEDEFEDEDGSEEGDPYDQLDSEEEEALFRDVHGYDEDDVAYPAPAPLPLVLPGGADWDIVIGLLRAGPARAGGAVPERLPGDTEITAGVWAREQPDQHHILYGAPLAKCPKLLSRIFKMRQLGGQLAWKCDLALVAYEWNYMKDAFAHQRIQPLLRRGERVLTPLPDRGFPQRFRPVDRSGQPLSGPRISRSGQPWNNGRQYFSSCKNGDFSSFIWADGVGAMEDEAQGSFNRWMGDGMFGY